MLTSSFRSEDGIDVEISGGTAAAPEGQGSPDSGEGKPNEPVDTGTQGGRKPGENSDGANNAPPDGNGGQQDPPKGAGKHENDSWKVQRKFDRLKRNHAAKMQKRDEKIAKLTEDLEKEKRELEVLRKEKAEGKATDEQVDDARLNARFAERELQREQEQRGSEYAENVRELVQARIDDLYPTDKAKNAYSEAIKMGQGNGAFKAVFSDEVTRRFLMDSDLGPKLTEHFCRRPEVFEHLLSLSEERRKHELFAMEARLGLFLKNQAGKKPGNSSPADPKNPQNRGQAPAIGKQANRGNGNNVNPNGDWASDDEVFQYVRSRR